MFTGIIEKCGILKERINYRGAMRLVVDAGREFTDVKMGDSVSVNGVCLSVTKNNGGKLYFDLMKETQDTTTLGALKIGAKLNLEKALAAEGNFSGHLVTGHIDGIGRVLKREEKQSGAELTIGVGENLIRYIQEKGSVAIDGTSLTSIRVKKDSFAVSLIPLTLIATNLKWLNAGDTVNVETDIIAKYAEKLLTKSSKGQVGLNEEFLKKYGYV